MPRPWLGIAMVCGVLLAALCIWCKTARGEDQKTLCADRTTVVRNLEAKHGEHLAYQATLNDSMIAEVFVSPSGNWTLLYSISNGLTCFIVSGKDWQPVVVARGRAS